MNLARTALFVAVAAGCGFATLASAAPTQSVAELFNRLPDLPATAEEAAKWVGKDGAVVHPGLIALRADIEAHRQAIKAMQAARQPAQRTQATLQVEALDKGMANVGIDTARMQRDPAYAREVQARMQQLSPQEAMAMAQKMAQPMNQDRRIVNQAQAMVEDSEVVRAAAAAGQEFGNRQVERVQGHAARWKAVEANVARVETAPIEADVAKPRMEYDNIGCDNACQAQWHAYAAAMLPKMIARDTQALRLRRDAMKQERGTWSPIVADANRHLVAAQYGATAKANAHQLYIDGLDEGLVGDLVMLLDKTEEIARRASRTFHCGEQAVLVPQAVCR